MNETENETRRGRGQFFCCEQRLKCVGFAFIICIAFVDYFAFSMAFVAFDVKNSAAWTVKGVCMSVGLNFLPIFGSLMGVSDTRDIIKHWTILAMITFSRAVIITFIYIYVDSGETKQMDTMGLKPL